MSRTSLAPYAVILLGTLCALILAFAPLSFLLTNLIPDDGFYYFQIARNISEGLGATFDGENLTNGFHPLWMVMLIPIFALFSVGGAMDLAPIHAALALSALLFGLTGLVIQRVISRYTASALVQSIALAVWFFNPYLIYEMLAGMETPLVLLFLSLLILAAIRYREQPTITRLVVVAVTAGFLMLSRLDTVFYFLAFFAWLLVHEGARKGIRNILISGLVAAVVVSPWLIWNYMTFGMVLTSSSVSSTIVNHELVAQDNGTGLFQQAKAVVYMTDRAVRLMVSETGSAAAFFVLIGAVLAWWIRADARVRSLIALEVFLFGGLAMHLILSASIRWTFRTWYFIAITIFVTLLVAWFLEQLRNDGKLKPFFAGAAVLLLAAIFFIQWHRDLLNRESQQANMLAATQWMNQELPEKSTIGIFNAGVQAYFSEHRVVNLDGLVNNRAAEALQQRSLWAYVHDEGITHISDFDLYMTYRYKRFLGADPFQDMELLHRIPNSPDGVGIWRVQSASR